MERNEIPMPTEREKRQAVARILEAGLPASAGARRELWDTLRAAGARNLFRGTEDCLALAALLWALTLFPAAWLAGRPDGLPQSLFLLSPALYAALSLLTAWKDLQTGVREWTWTFRLSARMVDALRMLCFAAVSVLIGVPAELLLWRAAGCRWPLSWTLSLALSGLFLYGALSLYCLRLRGAGRLLAAPALWLAGGAAAPRWRSAAAFLEAVPPAVFCLIAAAALALYLMELRRFCRRPMEGGLFCALR